MNSKIDSKEEIIRQQFSKIRALLNSKKVESVKNPNDWVYISVLGNTENKLNEIIEFFESIPD